MQEIKFASDLFKLILSGKKTTTVREGLREYALGPVEFVTDPPDKRGMVKTVRGFITKVQLKQFRHLTSSDAERGGYETIGQMVSRLKKIYPGIGLDDEVTIVEFRRLGIGE